MKNFRKSNQYRRRNRRERGVALIAALFALMLISALAMAMVFATNTESAVNSNFKDSQVAEYAAQAGIQEGRWRLVKDVVSPAGANPAYIGDANMPAGPPAPGGTGVLYITNPAAGEAVQPHNAVGTNPYYDTELCHDNFPGLVGAGYINPGNNIPCGPGTSGPLPGGVVIPILASIDPRTTTAGAMSYKWVRITQKTNISASPDPANLNYAVNQAAGPLDPRPVCWDKTLSRQVLLPQTVPAMANCDAPPVGDNDPLKTVYMLTALAVSPRGARRMVQAEVAFDPPLELKAPVMSDNSVTLNGALSVSGYDNCSCSCSGNKNTYSCVDRSAATPCNRSKLGIFASGTVQNATGANQQVYSGLGSGSGIAYQGSNTTPPASPFPYNVPNLVKEYSQLPGVVNVTDPNGPYKWTCLGTPANCGTQSSSQFGQATFPLNPPDNPAGMVPQLTYVPGNVKLTSTNATGSGVLIVNGDLEINGGLQFYGLILVSGTVTFTGGGSTKTNIYGGLLSGNPLADNSTTLGGSISVQYDICALNSANKGRPPRTLAMRELSY